MTVPAVPRPPSAWPTTLGRTRSVDRVGPIAGIVFAVLFAVSFLLPSTPAGDASDLEWTSYWRARDHRWEGIVSSLTMMLAAVAFLWFVAALRRRLPGGVGADAAFAAGIAMGAMMLAAGFGRGLIPLGYELGNVPIPTNPDVIRIVDGMYYGVVFLPLPYALAGFAIPMYFALRDVSVVPTWLRVAALAVGVVALTGPFLFVVPHLLFLLWTLAIGVTLLLRERPRPAHV